MALRLAMVAVAVLGIRRLVSLEPSRAGDIHWCAAPEKNQLEFPQQGTFVCWERTRCRWNTRSADNGRWRHQ